jgi:hypothetical protein
MAESFEAVVTAEEKNCDHDKLMAYEVNYRTAVRVNSLRKITVAQTRYLATVQATTNETLRSISKTTKANNDALERITSHLSVHTKVLERIAEGLEANNTLLTALVKKMDGAGEGTD